MAAACLYAVRGLVSQSGHSQVECVCGRVGVRRADSSPVQGRVGEGGTDRADREAVYIASIGEGGGQQAQGPSTSNRHNTKKQIE